VLAASWEARAAELMALAEAPSVSTVDGVTSAE
jgi:hypothetical protein